VPNDLSINVQVLTPDGNVATDTAQVPMAALLWYPPGRWQPGEVEATETLPSYLPATWAPVLTVKSGGQASPATGCRRGVGSPRPLDAGVPAECLADGRLLLPAMGRTGGALALVGPAAPLATPDARFQGTDWRVELSGYYLPAGAAPGRSLRVLLNWSGWGGTEPGPALHDYTVFVHLRDEAGHTVANTDATPTYFTAAPTNAWRDLETRRYGLDAHLVAVPAGLPSGRYKVVIGWYDLATGERLQVVDGQGNVTGDEYVLGEVQVDALQAPQPELACLVASEACASQIETREWAKR
jgi:hypothetical protein